MTTSLKEAWEEVGQMIANLTPEEVANLQKGMELDLAQAKLFGDRMKELRRITPEVQNERFGPI